MAESMLLEQVAVLQFFLSHAIRRFLSSALLFYAFAKLYLEGELVIFVYFMSSTSRSYHWRPLLAIPGKPTAVQVL